MLAIATAALAVNVKLVLFAMAATIPTFAPVVLPIQLPTANSVLNDVPAPVTVVLLVAQVTLPVNATFGKLVVN